MSLRSSSAEGTLEHLFRFDIPIPRRVFGDEYNITGWLLHPEGKPIHGIRALVKRPFLGQQVFPARRKRDRPDIAAAFPHLPEAKASGFLLELPIGFGRNHLTLQVRDHNRVWRTFHVATVWAYPLTALRRFQLHEVRSVLIAHLQRNHSGRAPLVMDSKDNRIAVTPTRRATAFSPRRVDLFATSKSNLFILEIGELVAAGFRELGCTAQVHIDQIPDASPSADVLQLVVTPHEYYNLFLAERLSKDEARTLTRNLVLLCTEQPQTGWFHANLAWAAHARAVADINPLGAMAYHAHGVRSHHFQLGYHPMLQAAQSVDHQARSYDITFLGSMTPRRDAFFAAHTPFFAQRRCHLRFVPLGFAKTKTTRSYLDPKRRNELLSQSRILLNVHYSERPYMEWHRLLVGLANGCCVISETSEGYGALIPGRHFIMADCDDLIACCEYYLNHPAECQAIAQQGHEFVRSELRQATMCEAFLREFEATDPSAPLAVYDSLPMALPSSLSRGLAANRRRQLTRALRRDLKAWFRSPSDLSSIEVSAVAGPASGLRSSVIERRQSYQTRLQQQEIARAEGKSVWHLHDSAAYNKTRPKVSVVITLFNYAHYIRDCVASVAQAAARMNDPVELVIVNDASTDDSMAQAVRCQAASSLPTRIVDKLLNTGLADARNVGTELARAPYVFMMDADNLILPNGLEELLTAIQQDNYAAAYCLLCRFKGHPANRLGLLSYYDWDPQILVQHPYIDAMAMFRRDVLLELGGYDTQLSQVGWFGWEDYDMWLRFARKNYPVGFVPNILCFYRHHDTSMINLTNLFELDLVRHFMSRYQELVARFEPRETLFGVEREKIEGVAIEIASIGRPFPGVSPPETSVAERRGGTQAPRETS